MSSLRALALLAIAAPAFAADAETVVLFDASAFETPESIQIDAHGSMYVSMALRGEVRRIDPDGTQETLAFLPIRPDVSPCGNAFGLPIMGGIALDLHGNVYGTVASCDVASLGVYQITPDGDVSLLSNLPPDAVPNGIAYRAGYLYVADTNLGQIWRIDASTGVAEVWADDALLAPLPDFFPGPNGLQIFRDEVYVSVSDRAHVVAFPVEADGSAGAARVHATGVGLDDFAFDVEGTLYGTTDPFNTVVAVWSDGTSEVLLDWSDGLDGPTAAAFGRGDDGSTLYVTNAAFPFFTTTFRPSIMSVDVGVPGKPR
jgi:sugar lactone lactonase YvrE